MECFKKVVRIKPCVIFFFLSINCLTQFREINIDSFGEEKQGKLTVEVVYNYENSEKRYDSNHFRIFIKNTNSNFFNPKYNDYGFYILAGQEHEIKLNEGEYEVGIRFTHYDKFAKWKWQFYHNAFNFCDSFRCQFKTLKINSKDTRRLRIAINQNRTELNYIRTVLSLPLIIILFPLLVTADSIPPFEYEASATVTLN